MEEHRQRRACHTVHGGGGRGRRSGDISHERRAGRPGAAEGWDASGSIRAPTERIWETWPWLKFDKRIEVQCVRLDTWAASQHLDTIDFIWADVQGAEIDLIEGGRETLARTRWFYTEYLEKEYYQGQINLAKICGLLPEFELVEQWKIDALFRRIGTGA